MNSGKFTNKKSRIKTTVEGERLSYKDKLLLEVEKSWVLNSIHNQRDTARSLLTTIGIFLGFYAVLISIIMNPDFFFTKPINLQIKIRLFGPIVFWIISIILNLYLIKPLSQTIDQNLQKIENRFYKVTKRTIFLLNTAIIFFLLGIIWFVINLFLTL